VAVRLLVERENEIKDFKPIEKWEIWGEIGRSSEEVGRRRKSEKNLKKSEEKLKVILDRELKNEKEVLEFLKAI
jgi:DNA topoisomerase IA